MRHTQTEIIERKFRSVYGFNPSPEQFTAYCQWKNQEPTIRDHAAVLGRCRGETNFNQEDRWNDEAERKRLVARGREAIIQIGEAIRSGPGTKARILRDKVICELKYELGLTAKEIEKITGISRNTLKELWRGHSKQS